MSKVYFNLVFLIAAEPLPLMELCRRVIRQRVGRPRLRAAASRLALPPALTAYLLYRAP